MARVIASIEGEEITEWGDGSVSFRAKAAIDSDGSGPSHGDKFYQSNTSLHLDGKPLNSDLDRYVVVPPAIIKGVKGIVLGCHAVVTNIKNGLRTEAVVADIGPRHKLGEVSIACAKALGINPDPVNGGTQAHICQYSIYPGRAASVEGKNYELQPS